MKKEEIDYAYKLNESLWTPRKEFSFHLWRLLEYAAGKEEKELDIAYMQECMKQMGLSFNRIRKEIEELRSLEEEVRCQKKDRPKKRRKKKD